MDRPNDVVLLFQPDAELDDLQQFLDQQEWNYEDEYPASDDAPYHIVWVTLDRRTRIRFVDDEVIGERYFYFSGNEASDFALRMAAILPCWDLAVCTAALSEAAVDDDGAAWLIRATLCARAVSEPLLAQIDRFAKADQPAMRDAALTAMAYTAWPEVHSRLQQIAEHDPEPELREDAALILDSLRATQN